MFNITYEIVTPESAEHGDAEERGFHLEDISFGEAMGELDNLGLRGAHCEADSCPLSIDCPPRYFYFTEGTENYETGAFTYYALHLPRHVTPASRMRLARLLGCYGAQ
jgi:hypothetical protein